MVAKANQSNDDWRAGFDEVGEDQLLRGAHEWTPLQRLEWLESVLESMGPELHELARNRARLQLAANGVSGCDPKW